MKSKNVTISLDEELLKAGKRYAKLKGTSINELFREFLKSKVVGESSTEVTSDLMDALDAAEGDSKGTRWKREDAYSR
jgi:hypothetical protein